MNGLDIAFTTDIFDDVTNAKGVANYVRFLASNFGNLNSEHEFSGVHFQSNTADLYKALSDEVIIDPYHLPGEGFQKLVTNRLRGQEALKEFDVVHATAPRLYYFPLFSSNSYKSILTVHAMDLHIPAHMRARLSEDPHAWFQQHFLDAYFEVVRDDIDAIITVSEFLKEELVEHKNVSPEKIYPVHLAPEDRFRVREDVDREDIILSDTPEPELIEMYHQLKQRGITDKLVVFSIRGYGYQKARELVKEYGIENSVEFRGYVPDSELVELYNSASVYVRMAGYEGFGLPPIEAMACGCPVVTTDVGSLPEVVDEAGITLPYINVDAFVDAVYSLLTDTQMWKKYQGRGLERAADFSWEQTASETVQVYEEVISND